MPVNDDRLLEEIAFEAKHCGPRMNKCLTCRVLTEAGEALRAARAEADQLREELSTERKRHIVTMFNTAAFRRCCGRAVNGHCEACGQRVESTSGVCGRMVML